MMIFVKILPSCPKISDKEDWGFPRLLWRLFEHRVQLEKIVLN